MDFIKGNEQVRIDPSGIDISGVGNIIIDSNSVTGDISFNNKVTVSEKLDVTGDLILNGNVSMSDIGINGVLDMCGNIKFEDTSVLRLDPDNTWFGPDLRGHININGGGCVT